MTRQVKGSGPQQSVTKVTKIEWGINVRWTSLNLRALRACDTDFVGVPPIAPTHPNCNRNIMGVVWGNRTGERYMRQITRWASTDPTVAFIVFIALCCPRNQRALRAYETGFAVAASEINNAQSKEQSMGENDATSDLGSALATPCAIYDRYNPTQLKNSPLFNASIAPWLCPWLQGI